MDKEEQSKILILEQGFRTLTKEGPKNFTVERLSSNLRMSKKTIYKYFPTKENLIEKIVGFFIGSIKRKFESVAESNENPIVKINLVMDYLTNRIMRVPTESLMEIKVRYPHIWKIIESFRLDMTQYFQEFFKDAQKQGMAKSDIDMDKAAILFMNIVNSTFQPEFFMNNNLAPVDTIKLFMKMISEGIFVVQTEKKQNHNKLIWEN